MNWWERFWYGLTHLGQPTPPLDDDDGWQQVKIQNDQNSALGYKDDAKIGNFFNEITGQNENNAFSAEQAKINRDWQTSERLATQEFNSAEAQKARDFSQMMESTRFQRTMDDMAAAGVNPMVAFMSGSASGIAGAGSTAAASASSGSSSPASASGNSAAAVGALIKALTGLVKAL